MGTSTPTQGKICHSKYTKKAPLPQPRHFYSHNIQKKNVSLFLIPELNSNQHVISLQEVNQPLSTIISSISVVLPPGKKTKYFTLEC